MARSFIASLCLILLAGIAARASAQEKFTPSPDGFRDFVLNETALDDAFKALGQPDADKTDKLDAAKIGKWLDAKHKEKVFRQLTYKKNHDFSKIELSFLDGKLVVIDLEFKKHFDPDKLPNLFGVRFALVGGPASLPDTPGQYPVPFFATNFPPSYNMVGISAKTFILVDCDSAANGSDRGTVMRTRQISRTLEKK